MFTLPHNGWLVWVMNSWEEMRECDENGKIRWRLERKSENGKFILSFLRYKNNLYKDVAL